MFESIAYHTQMTVGKTVGVLIAFTPFRFSKSYRHGETLFKKAVYAICNTVIANITADKISNR